MSYIDDKVGAPSLQTPMVRLAGALSAVGVPSDCRQPEKMILVQTDFALQKADLSGPKDDFLLVIF